MNRRACIDYFRPHSDLAALLEAHFARRERPTQAQIFAHRALHAVRIHEGREHISFGLDDDPRHIMPVGDLRAAYEGWKDSGAAPDPGYIDAHCWVFTPASLELLLRDMAFLRILRMEIVEISPTEGYEFIVALSNRASASAAAPGDEAYDEDYASSRWRLLHRINDEVSRNSIAGYTGAGNARAGASWLGRLLGASGSKR